MTKLGKRGQLNLLLSYRKKVKEEHSKTLKRLDRFIMLLRKDLTQ